jgi:glucan phosphoethanolaminetransferase (alkaline phosphatase superfamily)
MNFKGRDWDPTPFQYSTLGLVASWAFALVFEFFVLGEEHVWNTLKNFVLVPMNGIFGADLWNPLILWVLLPLAAFYFPILLLKEHRRTLMAIGVILLTSVLVLGDLEIRLF